jgi:hypothetical protein
MLLVVLGAGASYDSVPTYPPSAQEQLARENLTPLVGYMADRLPLADELFDFARRKEFAREASRLPQCQPILPYLENREDGLTVERELQRLQDEATEYPKRYGQLAAIRYYLCSVIHSCEQSWHRRNVANTTNQKTLLDQIEQWRKPDECVCLVTFNYDRMLEIALSTVGVEIQALPDYISNNNYKLIKLHGSTNWAREVDTSKAVKMNPSIANTLTGAQPWPTIHAIVDHAEIIDVTQRYQLLSHSEHPTSTLGGSALFPAIAIPIETKSDYECPNEHLEALLAFAPRVDKLLVVGWRGAEIHFLQTLAAEVQQDIQGHVVAGSSDEANETIERLQQAGIKGEYRAFGNGFTDFIRKREAEQLLVH